MKQIILEIVGFMFIWSAVMLGMKDEPPTKLSYWKRWIILVLLISLGVHFIKHSI
jgi:hypothetical protein